MGSVGLNFGSATSGDGIDVAATVSQIVTNLQVVETPWKSQLTKLTSQDTQLTSLGTQLSTLSTDLQNLTVHTGVLAAKKGSQFRSERARTHFRRNKHNRRNALDFCSWDRPRHPVPHPAFWQHPTLSRGVSRSRSAPARHGLSRWTMRIPHSRVSH